jgi:hypothetical protein
VLTCEVGNAWKDAANFLVHDLPIQSKICRFDRGGNVFKVQGVTTPNIESRTIFSRLPFLISTAIAEMLGALQALAVLQVLLPFALTSATEQHVSSKPNFVFILTDDQDVHLNSMDYMPLTQKHLAQKGTTFERHYCTIAVCCPARVALWTGKYAHNTVSVTLV